MSSHVLAKRVVQASALLAVLLTAMALSLIVPGLLGAQALPVSEDCVACHLKLPDARLSGPARTYDKDIHAEIGLGCLSCHGSGGSDVLDPAKGFLHAPERREIPGLCGRCHSDGAFMRQFNPGLRTDQVSEYWTSVHGKLLRQNNDTSVATCVDCHPAHNIRPPSDPASSVYPTNVVKTCGRCHSDKARMAGRGIPTDQVEKYTSSVHGKLLLEDGDLSAPVCNDCHGNHGAAPPGLSSVRNVCGQCHSTMADNFDKSGHEERFASHDLPGCATCHHHHDIQKASDDMLVSRTTAVCQQCHQADDPAGQSFLRIKDVLDSLGRARDRSQATLDRAENLGMEVSTALFELQDVTNAETRARNAIHSFDVASVVREAAPGFDITKRAQDRGDAALHEHTFRRQGLAVSTAFIFLLIAGLILKIRYADERLAEGRGALDALFDASLQPAASGAPPTGRVRLAASALLLEAAETLGPDVWSTAVEAVRGLVDLNRGDVDALVEALERQRGGPLDPGRLSAAIARTYSADGRAEVLAELWAVLLAQPGLARHEIAFVKAVAKLMHVDAEDVAAARRSRVAGGRFSS
jgi:predicted CXXCH cytochrome family protein